jgi:hypothetical protein
VAPLAQSWLQLPFAHSWSQLSPDEHEHALPSEGQAGLLLEHAADMPMMAPKSTTTANDLPM